MDAQLACVGADGKSGALGPLKGGFLLESTTDHSRKLLGSPMPFELKQLSKMFEFEMVVGANGRVWVDAKAPQQTMAVVQALQATKDLHEVSAIQGVLEAIKTRASVA
jgi:exosome complex component RRP40